LSLWLDVGCGHRSRGDVNLDLYIEPIHRKSEKNIDLGITRNFLIADANNLPFKTSVFEKVICQQLIEHKGINPCKLIKELYRVSRNEVMIECPHRYYWRRPQFHVNWFDSKLFRKILPLLGITRFKAETIYTGIPHELIPLIKWPLNIKVEIKK